ncbi:cylicin-1-like [Selaginella moellendorffii]|uniref:cylicin-1-like n=1 Tax=Selaginella moellendorffii TaxID=88036 RepID=UPI000D1C3D5D|nr:cylicin-1-like [Selaginella moellendorffii]XP_024519772.1 cylicin-1-like [Selaginella moellendorffii]XP_024519773.1 cylicin-1-like [Selaginella moellendorffii]XP_024519774.1 cylicin-1-like [Selaginella moellendorffii]|eukprot:XP_024519771.1 cylicin-1-like [Selaginella moellendorffii]
MRMAARNALTMFSSLHEYEDDGARHLAAEDAKRPGTSGENENQRLLRNGKVLTKTQEREDDEPPKKSPAETSDVGECRRPRSQRKLVLKLRNCAQTSNNEDTFRSLEIPEQGTSKVPVAEANDSHPETDGFIADENPTEAVSSDDKQGYIWKKGKAAKRAGMPYHSSSSSEEDKLVDVPCDTKKGLEATRVENGDTKVVARAIISESESEKSLSADYLDEQQRREQNHTLMSNESLQNGEAPDADNDPDYHEEVSPGSNSESLEDAYKPEEEQASEDLDVDDIQMKRNMNKAVYSRRRPRKVATKTECYEADEHASGGRRRSTRLAQGRVVSLSNSRSTRSRRNVAVLHTGKLARLTTTRTGIEAATTMDAESPKEELRAD